MTRLGKTKPNFFLIGAPKSGTTALSQYLAEHPEVLFSQPKEAKYFHSDFSDEHRLVHTRNQYLHLFGPQLDAYPAVGEGTVWYLYSQEAVPNILDFNPDALFLVMLRNPIDLVYSLHSQLVYGGDEDVEDFEAAWNLQERRRAGEAIPRFCRDPKSLLYGDIGKLGAQMECLLRKVSREQVLVLLFDDFRREPETTYTETLSFLGLASDHRDHFPVVNANKRVTRRTPARILHFGAKLKRKLGIHRSLGLWKAFSPLFTRRARRKALPLSQRTELASFFREDVRKLSRLINRDLAHWLGQDP